MFIKFIDEYYDDVIEYWYKIEYENENEIENLIQECYNMYEECEHEMPMYDILNHQLWELGISFNLIRPNMIFNIDNCCERAY